jgi:hypothetical protein
MAPPGRAEALVSVAWRRVDVGEEGVQRVQLESRTLQVSGKN